MIGAAKDFLKAVIGRETLESYRFTKAHSSVTVEHSVLLFIFDACRYDTFESVYEEEFPGKLRKAYSPACWTIPGHESILRGHAPFNEDLRDPWENEYPTIRFPIPLFHPSSFGVVSVLPLTDSPYIRGGIADYFDEWHDFDGEGASAATILEVVSEYMEKEKFFGMVNFEETHDPYGDVPQDHDAEALQQGQERQAEILIEAVDEFRPNIPGGTQVIITADHGDLFGENDGWFHSPQDNAMFHEKLFEVPFITWIEEGDAASEHPPQDIDI